MREKMTVEAIRDWALRCGFVNNGDGLSGAYDEGVIEIEFSKLKAFVHYHKGKERLLVSSGYISRVHIDENGDIKGLGLNARFTLLAEEGREIPFWFSQVLREYIENTRDGNPKNGV